MSDDINTNEEEMIEAECEELTTPTIPINQGEIDIQISTAHRFPRSLKRFKDMALAMATIDQDTAESCFYVLPRGGKNIEGPSVRLAEIVGSAWGNMRFGARIVHDDDKFITAQGMAFDLERNVAVTLEVRRRITDKYNRRYNDDMITVTGNAASSIALRNAIFRVIPKAYINQIYLSAKKVAVGDAQTLASRRQRMVDHFAKMGITKERIFAFVGVGGIDDIDLAALEKLIGVSTAIKDGEISIDEVFPASQPISEEIKAKNKTESLANKIKAQTQQVQEQPKDSERRPHGEVKEADAQNRQA